MLDTRKTTPGLRALEKYAVRAGGGTNKRMGLYDVAMIKDNHKLAAGGIAAAYRPGAGRVPGGAGAGRGDHGGRGGGGGRGRRRLPALRQHAPELLREVVAAVGDRAELEATGGLTLDDASAYAATGVDYLSVGALTHSSPILDIALDLRPAEPGSRLHAAVHRHR